MTWFSGGMSANGVVGRLTGVPKGRGMYFHVCGIGHIKDVLLLIGKKYRMKSLTMCSPCGGSGFLLSLPKWSFTICLMPYNRK